MEEEAVLEEEKVRSADGETAAEAVAVVEEEEEQEEATGAEGQRGTRGEGGSMRRFVCFMYGSWS